MFLAPIIKEKQKKKKREVKESESLFKFIKIYI